ncbi:hypothetical protein N7510_004569 [Penicillium lagena]|uniref:uncharacterized protein n=1 Tax=Penicillium lagena TaxID=94218 RepID=UPI002540E863|nr:uncharacterized protein N7510_004569 [Penicillium lagena]KAJ5620585.1 hypothetical protein N7510_004569 [Penicillium lagena]
MNFQNSADLQLLSDDLSGLKKDVETYLMKIHPWLPFLSKRKLLGQVLSPLGNQRPDHVLLLTAIKLVITAPGDESRSPAYYSIKSALLNAELKGILTFRILQALVLVAIYELGQAIYPSAYLTVGYCAKYGIALGINQTIDPNCGPRSSLVDSEEERRTWWAIILLDRLMNLGCPERAPVIEEPDGASILPMEDQLWDKGHILSSQPPTLSSLPTGAMGRFAFTVQAAFLLGRVLRNGRIPLDENGFQEEEARILDKAILALTQISLQESRQRGMGLCSPTTICHSARLILNAQMISWIENLPNSSTEMKCLWEIQRSIASDMLVLAQTLNRTGLCGKEESSPFCLDAMYRAAMIFGQVSQGTATADAQKALDDIESGFKVNSRRWKAAGIYAQLIQARAIAGVL